ncbi:mannosyl-3-phosphoglycerate phosphatase-related protein [Erwinia oleae]|uniref:mannosyl-3-phosphoglycerate phosphatase-related protein n=1 Tax=Erwinia oleae TaxID=796334 RepID=UPI00054F27AE|nr:mannosyl-3-phosphoglycerate phosphatase-related protein [Erwinia oleae]
MPTVQDPLMIVTDLDGSLLDHHTYGWEPAQSWLDRLNAADVPVVICSSKTAAEIVPLQQTLGISGAPWIGENGAVVNGGDVSEVPPLIPDGKDYPAICQTLAQLRNQQGFKFIGFADVTEKEVSEWTGLTPGDAALAKDRQGSESIIWRDSQENFDRFQQALKEQRLALIQGGRFWHVMNEGSGKATALAWLLKHIPSRAGQPWITLGLGDGPNDAPMLDSTDYAVVIKGYNNTPVTLSRRDEARIYRCALYGPEGWSEGLTWFLAQE